MLLDVCAATLGGLMPPRTEVDKLTLNLDSTHCQAATRGPVLAGSEGVITQIGRY